MSLETLYADVMKRRAKVPTNVVDVVDIITFCESSWGLGVSLFPVQRVILKAHYGLELDNNPFGLDLSAVVPDWVPNREDLIDRDGFYRHRVPISGWMRDGWEYLTEAEYLERLFLDGRSNIREVVPGKERRHMYLAIGRRSGKSTISAMIVAYELYRLISLQDPHRYYGINLVNLIQLISVAPGMETASQLYQEVMGYLQGSGFFAPYLKSNSRQGSWLWTPADFIRYAHVKDPKKRKASLKVSFRPADPRKLRGAGNYLVIMDEAAFFPDEGQQQNIAEVWKALVPSTAAFTPKDPADRKKALRESTDARVIMITSPQGKRGFFFKAFQGAFGVSSGNSHILAIQAPTWEVNPTITKEIFFSEYVKDPATFAAEWGAEFTDRTLGWIENPEDLLDCVVAEQRPRNVGLPNTNYFMGLDVALKGDGTAIAIGHLDPDGKVILDVVDWIKAGEGKYAGQEQLMFEDVADWVHGYCKRFYIKKGIFDQHIGTVMQQAFAKRGLTQIEMIPSTGNRASEYFTNFKNLMWDKRLALYNFPTSPEEPRCGYLMELLELQAELKGKGRIDVQAPRMPGKHDDRADAIVRMAWLAINSENTALYTGAPSRSPMANPHLAAMMRARLGGSHPQRMVMKPRREGWGNPYPIVPGGRKR